MRFWEKMRTFLCIFPIIHTKTLEDADANEDLRKRKVESYETMHHFQIDLCHA